MNGDALQSVFGVRSAVFDTEDGFLCIDDLVDVSCGNCTEHDDEKIREYGIRKLMIGAETHMLYRKDEHALNSVQLSKESHYAIVRKFDWVCGSIIWARQLAGQPRLDGQSAGFHRRLEAARVVLYGPV